MFFLNACKKNRFRFPLLQKKGFPVPLKRNHFNPFTDKELNRLVPALFKNTAENLLLYRDSYTPPSLLSLYPYINSL
jgi:hypothetical protein